MPRPDAYRIEAPELELSLALQPIPELWPHEHIVEAHASRLRRDIVGSGRLHDPIIADVETDVVLDGMHRLTVLDRLGYDLAPVCYVPYRDSAVEVASWHKRFGPGADAAIPDVLDAVDVPVDRRPAAETSRPEAPDHPVLLAGDTAYELAVTFEELEGYGRAIERVIEGFRDHGFDPSISAEGSLGGSHDGWVVLQQPVPDKATVIRAATDGTLLPANTSRHVIPSRPVGLDVPLDLLERPPEVARRGLTDHLDGRAVERRRTPPGGPDRAYDETVLVFR